MKRLWLTYAWDDNGGDDAGNVDFVIQQLEAAGLEVHFDRRSLVAGRRLWQEIAAEITDPDRCDAWAVVLTPNSLRSQAVLEELYYALDRALAVKGAAFPLFALLHQVDAKLMPAALRIRLGIPLSAPDWVARVVAAANGAPPGLAAAAALSPFITRVHDARFIEVRPRVARFAPFCIAIDLAHKDQVKAVRAKTPGNPYGASMTLNSLSWESTIEGSPVVVFQADNEASPTGSYYLELKKGSPLPARIWAGQPPKVMRIEIGPHLPDLSGGGGAS